MALSNSTLFALLSALGDPSTVTNLINFIEAGGGDGITALTGDVTATGGGGPAAATVVFVGGSSAANVHSAELAANSATNLNTASAIVKRDGSGNFSAGTITASLTGDASLDLPLSGSRAMTGALNMGTHLINNVVDPVSAQDAATKNYVDTHSSSLTFSDSLVNTGGNVTLVNDSASPTASQYYGTNGSSVLGYYNLPSSNPGTVTSVSVVNANGLAGSVSNPTSTPAITLSTTITGLLQGNGTAISAYTGGNLTDAGTDGIIITGGSGAVIGSGTSIAQSQSSGSQNGYLSSADWTTFNSKQPAGSYITALTGDGTASGPGSAAFTLSTVNGNVGSFGSSTSIPSFTVNTKGLITAASGNAVIAPAGTLSGTTLNSTVVTSSLQSLGIQSQALNMGTHLINNVVDPVSAQDVATKNYVDTRPVSTLAQVLAAGNNAAGQSIVGDTVASGLLTLSGTSNVTPGYVVSGPDGTTLMLGADASSAIANIGNIGTNPGTLTISGMQGSTSSARINQNFISVSNAGTFGTGLFVNRGRGSYASPAPLQTGDGLGIVFASVYDGASIADTGVVFIGGRATENHVPGSNTGTALDFYITPNGQDGFNNTSMTLGDPGGGEQTLQMVNIGNSSNPIAYPVFSLSNVIDSGGFSYVNAAGTQFPGIVNNTQGLGFAGNTGTTFPISGSGYCFLFDALHPANGIDFNWSGNNYMYLTSDHQVTAFVGSSAEMMTINSSEIELNGPVKFQTNVISTAPISSGLSGGWSLGSETLSSTNNSISVQTQQPVTSAVTTSDSYLLIKINGTEYKLLLHT